MKFSFPKPNPKPNPSDMISFSLFCYQATFFCIVNIINYFNYAVLIFINCLILFLKKTMRCVCVQRYQGNKITCNKW